MLLRPAPAALLASLTLLLVPLARSSSDWLAAYREPTARIIGEATGSPHAWERLAELTDTFGARLSGSENLERAIAWAVETMQRDGLENVRAEPVMVCHLDV